MKLRILLALCMIPAFASLASADTVWDESIDGDLSGDFSAPDPLVFLTGSNTIIGSTGANGNTGATNGSDADYLTFSLGAGQQLTALTIDSYTFTGADPGVSFLGYVAGTAFTGQDFPDIDGSAVFAAGFGDVLGQGIGQLGPGNYSFWLQETSDSIVDYQFTFQVSGPGAIPEPSGAFLLTIVALGYVSRRNRVLA